MARNIRYLLIDASTGFIVSSHSVPPKLFRPADIPEGQRVVVPDNGVLPAGAARLDLRKVRKPINHVASVDHVMASWRRDETPESHRLEIVRGEAIDRLDRDHAARIAGVAGPLGALHAEKRRQAEAGDGPLVADEADRLAILANATQQDERLAAIERDRRAAKAAIRAATTEDEIKAALAASEKGNWK